MYQILVNKAEVFRAKTFKECIDYIMDTRGSSVFGRGISIKPIEDEKP